MPGGNLECAIAGCSGCIARNLENVTQRINEGRIRAQSSEEFLKRVVVEGARAAGADYGFISQVKPETNSASTLVLYDKTGDLKGFSYLLEGTPCEVITNTREVFMQLDNVCTAFPHDQDLVDLGLSGYTGAPLLGHDGAFLGIFSFMFRGAHADPELINRIFLHFAPLIAAEMERSEAIERQTLALEGSGNGIWDWSREEGVVHFDDYCRKMLGYTREDLPDSFESWLGVVHPRDREMVQTAVRDHIRREQVFDIKARMQHRDGDYRWFRARAQAVRSAEGRAMRVLGTLTDIDDLEQARRNALAASDAKSTFLTNMSHEIRTPMNAVMGMLQMLSRSEVSDEQQEWIEIAYGSAETLLTVLNDVLDLSRMEAGKIDVNLIDVNLQAVLNEIHRLFVPLAVQKGITLRLAPMSGVSGVRVDPNRLRQIVNNLLSNAIKFTSSGSVEISVNAMPNGRIRLSVADTGTGISEEVRKRLFQRFEQGDNSITRRFGGSGLGLAICKGLADRMDATLGVESDLGRGSTFWVDMPAAAAQDAA